MESAEQKFVTVAKEDEISEGSMLGVNKSGNIR